MSAMDRMNKMDFCTFFEFWKLLRTPVISEAHVEQQNVHTCPPLIVIFSVQKLTPHEMCKNHKGKKDLVFYYTLLNKISHVVSDPHHLVPMSRNFGT